MSRSPWRRVNEAVQDRLCAELLILTDDETEELADSLGYSLGDIGPDEIDHMATELHAEIQEAMRAWLQDIEDAESHDPRGVR